MVVWGANEEADQDQDLENVMSVIGGREIRHLDDLGIEVGAGAEMVEIKGDILEVEESMVVVVVMVGVVDIVLGLGQERDLDEIMIEMVVVVVVVEM